jgi:ribosomal-protein-alanine N-acetyltransferase
VSLDLTTARLTLRPLTAADAAAAHALWTQPEVRRYLWNDEVVTLDRVREVIAAGRRDFAARRYGLWGVYDTATGAFAGFAGCREWPDGGPELMYGLAPAWWGRGLATEAAEAVLAYLFETLGYPHVMAATDPPNLASVRVMERLGMAFHERCEMHGLDTLVYRLSRERWRRLRGTSGG